VVPHSKKEANHRGHKGAQRRPASTSASQATAQREPYNKSRTRKEGARGTPAGYSLFSLFHLILIVLDRRASAFIRGERFLPMIVFRKPLEGIQRPQMEADVVIVGGGPAGMACALRLSQVIDAHNARFPHAALSKGNIYVR